MCQSQADDKYTTKATQEQFSQYYPRKGDPKEFIKYLEAQRTSLVSYPKQWEFHEQERRRVTEDNERAYRNCQKSGVSCTDFYYNENCVLRHIYKTYKNDRDNPNTGEGPGNAEYRPKG